MIVWDTNVVSELMRPEPHEQVVAWTDRQPVGEVFITAITLAELWYGISRLPPGRRVDPTWHDRRTARDR